MRELKEQAFILRLQADYNVDLVEALQDVLEEALPKRFTAFTFKEVELPKFSEDE